jgi:low temperature requirement protein LtrA
MADTEVSALADRLDERLVEQEQRVTPLELFLDLVFIFAITQVTGYVSADPTWSRLAEGLAVLAVSWWVWSAYAWLGNTAASDEGPIRLALLSASAAMLVASLAVPHAFGADGVTFGVAILVVRLLHLWAYTVVARSRGDTELGLVVFRLGQSIVPASLLLVVAGDLDGAPQAACWAAALAIDYGGLALRGTEGWRVQPAHFAERHGLIVIIALGESIVSLGVGASGLPLDAGVVSGALFGIAVSAALWWAYFDVVAIVAERRLRRAPRWEQVLMARDSFTYLHLPMITGIVLFAVGVKKTLAHTGAHLHAVPATTLCGGVALYLVALSAFKRRNVGSFNYPRLVAAALLAGIAPLATRLPALLSLGLVALTAIGLIAHEVVRYAEARNRIRHGG